MNINAIIFDADEMIVKREEYFSSRLAREYNIPSEKVMPFFKGDFQDCIVGKADLKEKIAPLLEDWGWKGTVQDLLDYWFRSEQELDERVLLEIEKLKAKGIGCYLATKNEKYRTEYMKKNMGFEKFFDGIYSSCDIGHKKPEKEFYEFIFRDLNSKSPIKPEEIMFWDNEEEHVTSAKPLGWQGFVYENFDDFCKVISQID